MELKLILTFLISYILSVILLYFIKPKFILKTKNERNKEIDILKLNLYSVFFSALTFLLLWGGLLFYNKRKQLKAGQKTTIQSEKENVFNFIIF